MRQLQAYDWPGNIRELQNLLERQVILSRGGKLVLDDLPAAKVVLEEQNDLKSRNQQAELLTDTDYKKMQVQTIISALKKAKGKVYGETGAAALLGIKPTTLSSRIKKYGIDKNQVLI